MGAAEAPIEIKYTQQEMLVAIVASAEDAIVGKTLDGTIKTWNHGAELLYGYTAEEAIGKSISMIIPDDRKEELQMFLDKIRRGERVDHHETQRLKKDGTLVDVSVSLSPIRDVTGVICGAAAIARDISKQIKAKAELKESNEALESKIKELQKINALSVDRELKMIELKDEIKKLQSHPDGGTGTQS